MLSLFLGRFPCLILNILLFSFTGNTWITSRLHLFPEFFHLPWQQQRDPEMGEMGEMGRSNSTVVKVREKESELQFMSTDMPLYNMSAFYCGITWHAIGNISNLMQVSKSTF